MRYKIAAAEDTAIYRRAFEQKVNLRPSLELMFIAENGNEFLEKLKKLQHHLLPQVAFIDIAMPELNGIEAIRLAKSLYPQIHFIILSVFDDDKKIFEAIKSGASGYLLKHESAAVLEEAVVNVCENGGAPMSPAIARKTLAILSQSNYQQPESTTEAALPSSITNREKEILQFMINGWDAKRIAAELDLSYFTIRKHIANIYDKLHVSNRSQIMAIAHKNRWT